MACLLNVSLVNKRKTCLVNEKSKWFLALLLTKHPYGRVIKLNPETFERKIMKNKTKKKNRVFRWMYTSPFLKKNGKVQYYYISYLIVHKNN